jgi:hypothetical protein
MQGWESGQQVVGTKDWKRCYGQETTVFQPFQGGPEAMGPPLGSLAPAKNHGTLLARRNPGGHQPSVKGQPSAHCDEVIFKLSERMRPHNRAEIRQKQAERKKIQPPCPSLLPRDRLFFSCDRRKHRLLFR